MYSVLYGILVGLLITALFMLFYSVDKYFDDSMRKEGFDIRFIYTIVTFCYVLKFVILIVVSNSSLC